MQAGLRVVALVCGLATAVFILIGLRRAFVSHKKLGMRALPLTSVLSLPTGVFTVWQLALAAQQLHFGS